MKSEETDDDDEKPKFLDINYNIAFVVMHGFVDSCMHTYTWH